MQTYGQDFERQPPLSPHFVVAVNELIAAGCFDQGSAEYLTSRAILREKLSAGQAQFRSAATTQLGSGACESMFAAIDVILQEEDPSTLFE